MTGADHKDVLALFDEDGTTVTRRIHGTEGRVVWEHREVTKDVPLQVSTNVEKVFVSKAFQELKTWMEGIYGLKVRYNMTEKSHGLHTEFQGSGN